MSNISIRGIFSQLVKSVNLYFFILFIFFIIFLILPLFEIIKISLSNGISIKANFQSIIFDTKFIKSFNNSLIISSISALTSSILGFILAYCIQFTSLSKLIKNFIKIGCQFPMLLPTITYGFTITYTFGKNGLFTKIFGVQLFTNIYGFKGLYLGYIIYTLPIAFLLINDSFYYIDRKTIITSLIMKDSCIKRINNTLFKPSVFIIISSFIQCFFLAFTDFGIPASIGGNYDVISIRLYDEMLGSYPSFSDGAKIAIIMLFPSIISICTLGLLSKRNLSLQKIQHFILPVNKIKEFGIGLISCSIVIILLCIFFVIFIIPFIKNWPYQIEFDLSTIMEVLKKPNLLITYFNSLKVALYTSVIGTIIIYVTTIIRERTNLNIINKKIIDYFSIVCQNLPGMVLGIGYLLLFSDSFLSNTLFIIVFSNIIHYFTTPYLMSRNALSKINKNLEITCMLLGDSWFKSLYRVLIPVSLTTFLQVFAYYFIHSMCTISAIIFISSSKTSLLTNKIKELQNYGSFDKIFVLSIFILLTNLVILFILKIIIECFNTFTYKHKSIQYDKK